MAKVEMSRLEHARQLARAGQDQMALMELDALHDAMRDSLDYWLGKAYVHQKLLSYEAAHACYREAIRLQPESLDAHYGCAFTLQKLGRFSEADRAYEELLARPDGGGALKGLILANLSKIAYLAGDHHRARTFCVEALEVNPDMADAHWGLALIHRSGRNLTMAEQSLLEVLKRQPGHVDAVLELVEIFLVMRRTGEALKLLGSLEKMNRVGPRHALNYLKALAELKRHDEAYLKGAMYLEFLRQGHPSLDPANTSAWFFEFIKVLIKLGKTKELFEIWEQRDTFTNDLLATAVMGLGVELRRPDVKSYEEHLGRVLSYDYGVSELSRLSGILFMLQFVDVPASALKSIYEKYAGLAASVTGGARLCEKSDRGNRKIRLGYLSPDFNDHIMGVIFNEMVAHHDRNRFEIFCYSLKRRRDGLTRAILAKVDRFVDLSGLSAAEAAQVVADDRVDVLVDLAGHSRDAMPMIFAYRPACLQLTHLGYHGALGLREVDFKITDAYSDTHESGNFLIERLLPMARSVIPFRHVPPADVPMRREDLDLPEDAVLFGEFVNVQKLSPRCLALWSEILRAVDKAYVVFSFFDKGDEADARCLLAAHGIPASRIRFMPVVGDERAARARYTLIDIVLDTLPYSGGDTTVAALDMDVPVVTLCGNRHAERVSCSILRHLGMESTIAHSEDEYVSIAVELAVNADKRQQVSECIREKKAAGAWGDMAGYTRALEDAYVRALELTR